MKDIVAFFSFRKVSKWLWYVSRVCKDKDHETKESVDGGSELVGPKDITVKLENEIEMSYQDTYKKHNAPTCHP